MHNLSFVCLIVCCLFQSCLSVNSLREELLNEEDLQIVKLRGYRNNSFTSPTDKRCLLVASSSGCTRWQHQDCRNRRSIEVYDPECSIFNGRRVKNCKVQNDFVPAENVVSVCGIKWTRDCQGPCFNCPESCKAQFEKTCWRNQQVKSSVNIISINGVDIYTEKEYLESLYSCSQNKVADVCAPKNCRFIESPEDCVVQNDTNLVDLQTRTCNLCTATIQEARETCNPEIHEDCRNDYPFAWAKLCSRDESNVKDLVLPVSTPEAKNEIMADFAALYSKSLGPVNSLILKTLRDIDIDDVSNGTVVVISTQRPSNAEHTNQSQQKFEILEEMTHSSEHLSVNVNVKYDFTDQNPPKALQHKPSNTPRPRSAPLLSDESLISQIIELTDELNSQELENDSVDFDESSNIKSSNSQSQDNVYFDQAFQILNARERNELSGITITTARYQQPTFIFNTRTSSQIPTMTTTTTTTITTTTTTATTTTTTTTATTTATTITTTTTSTTVTAIPASPLSISPRAVQYSDDLLDALLSFDSSTTTTSTTTTSTTTTTATTTTTTVKPRKKLTSGDLLKLCWMNRIGCDFNYEEAMTATPLTTSTRRTTTRRPTTTKGNNNTGLSAMEKVQLCFKYSICSEEEFQEVELRGRERNGEEVRSQPQIVRTTTTRRPTTTTESESYKELKARAAQCFWKGIC